MADLIYEKLQAGTTKEDSDSGAEVARKFNDNFQKVSEVLGNVADTAKVISTTLLSSNWNNGNQTVAIEGMKSTDNGIISLQNTISSEAFNVASRAKLFVFSQDEGSLTISAAGDIPTKNIPITIVIFG